MEMMRLSVGERCPIDFGGEEGAKIHFTPNGVPHINIWHLVPNLTQKEFSASYDKNIELALSEVEGVLFLSFRFFQTKTKGFKSSQKLVTWGWQECPFVGGVYSDEDFNCIEDIANQNMQTFVAYTLVDTAINIVRIVRPFTLPPEFVFKFVELGRKNNLTIPTQNPILQRLYSRYPIGEITDKHKIITAVGGIENAF